MSTYSDKLDIIFEVYKSPFNESKEHFKNAEEYLRNDEEFVLDVVMRNGLCLEYAGEKLKKNRKVVLFAVKHQGSSLQFADGSLKMDREIVLEAVKQSGLSLQFGNDSIKKDRQIVLEAVKGNGLSLQFVDNSLKMDREVVLEAVREDGNSLQFADSFTKDREIVLEAVKSVGLSLEYADNSLKKDREIVLEAVKGNGLSLQFVDDSLKKDKGVVLEAVEQNGLSLQYADDSLKKDREVVLEAVREDGNSLQFVDDSLKKDKGVVLEAVEQNGLSLEYADDSLKKDREVVLEAVREDGNSLQFADDSLKKEKNFVLESLNRYSHSLAYVDDSFKKDREIILKSVKRNGYTLQYADESFKKDKEIVMEAVKSVGLSLQYADVSLKKDGEIVLEAVKGTGLSLQFADDSFKKDRTIVIEAVKQNGFSLQYADDSLKIDEEVVLEAVKQSGCLIDYADGSLKKDREFALRAIKQNEYSLHFTDFKENKVFVLEAVKKNGNYLDHVYTFQKDREVVLEAVKQNGSSLVYADYPLNLDREIVLEAVKKDGFSLRFADDSLKKDRTIVIEAVKQNGFSLQYADDSLKIDEEVVLEAVKQDGNSLQFAHYLLKRDRKFVLNAARYCGYSFRFADDSLKKDREFVLEIVKKDSRVIEELIGLYGHMEEWLEEWLLRYADPMIQRDDHVVLTAVSYMKEEFFKEDPSFLVEKVRNNKNLMKEIRKKLGTKRNFKITNYRLFNPSNDVFLVKLRKAKEFQEKIKLEESLHMQGETIKLQLLYENERLKKENLRIKLIEEKKKRENVGNEKLKEEIVLLKRMILEVKNKSRKKIENMLKDMDRFLEIPVNEFEVEIDKKGEKKCLGVGRYGEVFLYSWKKRGKKVAIKIIPTNLPFITIQKEVKAVMWMRDVSILEVFGYVKFKQNEIGVVSEFMEGGSLKNVDVHILSSIHQWFVIKKMISAVNYIHSRVDKELKYVKLCDFGLIKINSVAMTMTSDRGHLRGSIFYTPPEYIPDDDIIRENVPYSQKGDIWSLGFSFIEILTGKNPLRNYSSDLLFHLIRKKNINIPDSIHPVFRSVIEGCLQKDVDKRKSSTDLMEIIDKNEEKFLREFKSPKDKFEGMKKIVEELSVSILDPFYGDEYVEGYCKMGLKILHSIEKVVANDHSLKIVDILGKITEIIFVNYDKIDIHFGTSTFNLVRFFRKVLELSLLQSKAKQVDDKRILEAVQKVWEKNGLHVDKKEKERRLNRKVRFELELIRESIRNKNAVSEITGINPKTMVKNFDSYKKDKFLHIVSMRFLCWKVLEGEFRIKEFVKLIESKTVDVVVLMEIMSMLSKMCTVWTNSENQEKSFEELKKYGEFDLYIDPILNSLIHEEVVFEMKRIKENCSNKKILEKLN